MTEVVYIAFGHTTREEVWIRRFIIEIDLDVVNNVVLHGNNMMSINLTRNAES